MPCINCGIVTVINSFIAVPHSVNLSFTASIALLHHSLILSHMLIQNSLNPSQLFHKYTKPATNAATAAITKVIGLANMNPHKVPKAGIRLSIINVFNIKKPVRNAPNTGIKLPIAPAIEPSNNNSGPKAANTPAITAVICAN
ncbi:hypothetical protein SDC9_122475 [bioreactor metagenome]|uniref:Uncharacterized protein n=1 Tax=bioreactor metagenome TaxID=1076179 RepID=A0A645CF51_9ZZZZ